MVQRLAKLKYNLLVELDSANPTKTGYSASLIAKYWQSSALIDGVSIRLSRQSTGSNNTTFTFGLGAAYTTSIPSSTITGADSLTAAVEFTDFRMLSTGYYTASKCEFYVNGSLHHTINNLSFNGGTIGKPSGIGSVGWGPELAGTITGGYDGGSTITADVTLTVTGGFEYKIDANDTSYATIPCTTTSPPSGGFPAGNVPAPYGLTWGTHYSATNSNNMQCIQKFSGSSTYSGPAFISGWTSSETSTIYFASNEKPELHRYNDDFECRLGRTFVPTVEASGRMGALDRDNYPAYVATQYGATTYNTVLSSLASGIVDIDENKSTLETDYLERDHYCGGFARVSYSELRPNVFPSPPDPVNWISEVIEWDFPTRVNNSTTQPDAAYEDDVLNRWPHYYIPTFTFTYNAIPQTNQMSLNHRLFQFGDSEYGRVFFGQINKQPGICYSFANSASGTSSKAYTQASSSLFSTPTGSLTFNSTGVVSTGYELRIDLMSITAPPYLYGTLANKIYISPESQITNIYLEDGQGARMKVTPVSGNVSITRNALKRTGGSWYRDWGLRGLRDSDLEPLLEFYEDIPSNGLSFAQYVDTIRMLSSQSRYDGGWEKVIIQHTGTLTLPYPTLYRDNLKGNALSADHYLLQNNDRFASYGGGCLFPTATTIGLEEPGFPPRIGDWLAFKRYVLDGVGTSTITSEITGLFVSTEGSTYAGINSPAVFIMPSGEGRIQPHWRQTQYNNRFCFNETSSALVPVANTSTSDRWLYSIRGGQTFGFTDYLDVYDSSDVKLSTNVSNDGYLYKSRHSSIEDWDVPDDYLKMNFTKAADVRSLHCYAGYTYPPQYNFIAGAIAGDHTRCFALGDETNITVTLRDTSESAFRTYTWPGYEVSVAEYNNNFYLAVTNSPSAGMLSIKTPDNSLLLNIATNNGKNPALCVYPDGQFFVYFIENNTDLYVHGFDTGMNTTTSTTAVLGIGEVDPLGLASVIVTRSNGRPLILLGVIQSSQLKVYESRDGVTFT